MSPSADPGQAKQTPSLARQPRARRHAIAIWRLACLPAGLLMLPMGAAWAADYDVITTIFARADGTNNGPGNGSQEAVGATTESLNVSSVAATPAASHATSSSNVSAFGQAGPGALHAATAAAVAGTFYPDDIGNSVGNASVSATLTDQFIIDAPGCATCTPGSVGLMTFALGVDGGMSSSGAVSSGPASSNSYVIDTSWSFSVSVSSTAPTSLAPNRATVSTDASYQYRSATGTVTSSANGFGIGTVQFTIAVLFDRPVYLNMSATAGAEADIYPSWLFGVSSLIAQATSDFSDTMGWAGVVSLTDSSGHAVTGFTALDAAGVDYTPSLIASVPEPSSPRLAVAGLGLLGWWVRRRLRSIGARSV